MANRFLSNIKINDAYTFPASDGTNGQFIATDGAGNLSFQSAGEAGATVIYKDLFTGDASTLAFTLANSVDNEVKTQVYFDGVYQSKENYTVSGSTITFSTAPPSGAAIEVITFATVAAADYNQKLNFYGKAVGTITKGDAVMFAGAQGDHFLITKATQVGLAANHEYFLGLAAHDFSNNQYGYVTQFGRLEAMDTSGYTTGDILWFDSEGTTAGAVTTTEPSAPNTKIQIAAVVRVHQEEGVIFVRPTIYHTLSEQQDVSVTSVADKDLLAWNTSTGVWENTKTLGNITTGNITTSGTVDGVDVSLFKSDYDTHNHDSRYYTETEIDTFLTNKTNWDTAYGWGDHSVVGYLTSFTETDPIYTASSWYTTTNNSTNWNTAFGWGDHAGLYLPIGHDMTLTLGGDLSGAVTFTNMGNATLTATIVANSVALGTDTTGNYMVNVSAGGGISVSHTQGEGSTATVSHADTSSAANLTASGRTYVTGLTFDTYGHVTGYTTGTETVVDTNTTYTAGGGLTLSGTTFSHTDTSSQASVNNSGRTYIQDITLDTYGHVTGIVSATDSDAFTGTVTSVSGTGSYGGLTLSGTVTTSGSLTLGGTPSGTWPISVSGNASGFSTSLYYTDNRAISPSELSANRMSFGFTSFNNNNTAPWADFIHMRSYQDSSGGSDNLLVFSKSSLAARLYQQTYGSATAYSSYVDFITSGNIGSQSVSSAATLTTARTINGTSFNGSANITTNSWGTARTISLTGAVTGSVSVNGSANVSIATTHTADPVLTLTGDATGSATFTNLGNATLTVTVVDDSHTHDGRYYTESESDGRYIIRNSGFEWTGTGASALSFRSLDTIDTASGDQAALEVYQDTAGADAFMQFHINGDYAKYFGLHGGINDFVIGGWSHGASYQRIFHDGYHPNADTLTTARTISLGGDVTGSASFNGSANITITAAVADDSHSHAFNNLTSKTSGTGTYSTSGDFRAPVFYDINNTSYYVDPNGNAVINKLTIGSGATSVKRLYVQETEYANGPMFMRASRTTDVGWNVAKFAAQKTTAIGNGFGPTISFHISDTIVTEQNLGEIQYLRKNNSTSGQFTITTTNTGAGYRRFYVEPAGYVYLGEGIGEGNHVIRRNTSQGNPVLTVSAAGTSIEGTVGTTADTAEFFAVSGAGANAASAAMKVGRNSSTLRSINAAGTINASGADYAEYMTKAIDGDIRKGDVVGVDANGELTNIYADSISFVVKSTDPSYVGNDVWYKKCDVEQPSKPLNTDFKTGEVDELGNDIIDNDALELAYKQYELLLSEYMQKIESVRGKVDRIAFSGQVPCNVYNASVGDYIVPSPDENGNVIGIAISSPSFDQYRISVGRVWKIMEDGRAWIAVKVS